MIDSGRGILLPIFRIEDDPGQCPSTPCRCGTLSGGLTLDELLGPHDGPWPTGDYALTQQL